MSVYMDYLAKGVGYESYDAYLRSEHWTFFSNAIRSSKCFVCGREDNLQVHHTTYDNLGSELPTDVVTVCDRCHVKIHDLIKGGAKLDKAHYTLINKERRRSKKAERKAKCRQAETSSHGWVSDITDLCNPAFFETVDDVMAFLIEQGYVDDDMWPTDSAFRRRLVKLTKGNNVRWHKTRYRSLRRDQRRASRDEREMDQQLDRSISRG